jgi:hypothetical protein
MSEMNDTDRRNAMKNVPKWAQREIEALEQQVAQLTRRVAELSEGPEDSDVIEHDYVSPSRPLRKGAVIRFLMGEGEYIEIHHDRKGGRFLELRGSGSQRDSGALAVQPQVSNVLRVRMTGYW